MDGWNVKIFGTNTGSFDKLAISLFHFQYQNNEIYRQYVDSIRKDISAVNTIEQIPFLPVRLFKTHPITTTKFEPAVIFESSGTTGMVNSRHYVKDTSLYEESFTQGFHRFYDNEEDWCIIGLLPSYLERENSSLVYMVEKLIVKSNNPQSGFYLHNLEVLNNTIATLEVAKQKTLLIGVTYALLDFAERFPQPLQYTIIMETGGMKGRRTEMIREEVHQQIMAAFQLQAVHSEYGMTELLSQAYSKGEGVFECPPWMKVLVRDEEDPGYISREGKGVINVIDLANLYSCAFIATDDVGKIAPNGSFEILGRLDGSDLRGCSLLTI